EETDASAERSLPGDERHQQQQGAAELGQRPPEVAVGVEAVRLVDRVTGLHPEEPEPDEEELRDHPEEVQRDDIALSHRRAATNRSHGTPSFCPPISTAQNVVQKPRELQRLPGRMLPPKIAEAR